MLPETGRARGRATAPQRRAIEIEQAGETAGISATIMGAEAGGATAAAAPAPTIGRSPTEEARGRVAWAVLGLRRHRVAGTAAHLLGAGGGQSTEAGAGSHHSTAAAVAVATGDGDMERRGALTEFR